MTRPKTDAEDAAWREGHAQGVAEQTALTVRMREERDEARLHHLAWYRSDYTSGTDAEVAAAVFARACEWYGTTWALTVRDRL